MSETPVGFVWASGRGCDNGNTGTVPRAPMAAKLAGLGSKLEDAAYLSQPRVIVTC